MRVIHRNGEDFVVINAQDWEPVTDLPPLTRETLWDILNHRLSDDCVNQLLWQALGYRYNEMTQTWDISAVDTDWSKKYSTPPDFIGSRPATVQLTRSIPPENKQLLKADLGFSGYTIDQLTPTLTRRATAVSWLLSYLQTQGLLK